MAVEQDVVQKLIQDYQSRFAAASLLRQNGLAFRAIQAFRNAGGDSANESLAAAEHYLFSRYMVSNAIVSQQQMIIMVLGYDGVKAIAQQNRHTEQAIRHNKERPTSKVSAASIDWGLRGAKDGEADRMNVNPDQSAPFWNWDAMKFGGVTDKIAEFGKKAY